METPGQRSVAMPQAKKIQKRSEPETEAMEIADDGTSNSGSKVQEIERQIQEVERQIQKVERQIQAFEEQNSIHQVETRLQEVEENISEYMRKVEGNEGIWMKLIEHLMSKEAQLRTEKEQYMKEKEQLRKEKEQLRKEKQQLRDELHLRMQSTVGHEIPWMSAPASAVSGRMHSGLNDSELADKFQRALMKAEVTSNILKFDEPFPWLPHHNGIYIRSAYEDIYTILKQDQRHYMIVGNPGTGKSYFAIYVLYRALRASKTVVFHRSSEKVLYLFKPGQKAKMGLECNCIIEELTSSESLYLYDAGMKTHALQPTQRSRLIAFASPSHDKELSKLHLIHLHMPIWTMDELLLASNLDQYRNQLTNTQIEDLFEKFGGIPRYVLVVEAERKRHYLGRLDSEIVQCTLHAIENVGHADIDKQSHMIFHQHSGSDSGYQDYEFKFASQYVGDKVVDTISRRRYDEMKAFALRGDTPSEAASLRGWILERIVHDNFPKGGTFHVRKLSDNKEEKREFPQMSCTIFDKLENVDLPNLPSLVYLRPKSRILEAADAFCPPNSVFQITVGKSHPIKVNGLKKILEELRKHKDWTRHTRINFYFVVPPDVYKCFNREQQYHTAKDAEIADSTRRQFVKVDQYVLNFEF